MKEILTSRGMRVSLWWTTAMLQSCSIAPGRTLRTLTIWVAQLRRTPPIASAALGRSLADLGLKFSLRAYQKAQAMRWYWTAMPNYLIWRVVGRLWNSTAEITRPLRRILKSISKKARYLPTAPLLLWPLVSRWGSRKWVSIYLRTGTDFRNYLDKVVSSVKIIILNVVNFNTKSY